MAATKEHYAEVLQEQGYNHFSDCCSVPVRMIGGSAFCSNCALLCTVISETSYHRYEGFVFDFTPTIPKHIEPDQPPASLTKEELIRWGRGVYWFPVVLRRYTDWRLEETYEVIYETVRTEPCKERGTVDEINERRKNDFITWLSQEQIEKFIEGEDRGSVSDNSDAADSPEKTGTLRFLEVEKPNRHRV